jgi:hypothetical protein
MGRGQEEPPIRLRLRRPPGRDAEEEEEHVLSPGRAMEGSAGAGGTGVYSPRRMQQLAASPSLRRKLRELQEEEAARRHLATADAAAPSAARRRRRVLALAVVWLVLFSMVLPTLAVLATAWRKYRSPHRIGFGAAWVSMLTGLFPLIEHDELHNLDLQGLHASRRRLDQSNLLNIGARTA